MLRAIARGSFIYYLSGILTKGISFFLLPLYTSILSREDYGVLELMSIISTLAIIIFSLQINQAVARFYNELKGPQVKIYTSTVALFSLASFAVFFLMGYLFRHSIAEYLRISSMEAGLAMLSISLNGLFYLSQNQLTWKIQPGRQMISSLAYNIVTIGLTLLFILYYKEGIAGIFKAQIIGALAGTLLGVIFTRHDVGMKFSTRALKRLFAFSVPLIPGALSIFLYMFTDRICIKEMLGLQELGVYSVGNKIATILTFATAGFSTALTPVLYKHYRDRNTPEKIAFLFRGFSVISFSSMAFLAFAAPLLIDLLATPEYEQAVYIIPFLLFAVFLNSLTFFFPGLNLANKTSTISLIAVVSGVLNILFNILLIPLYGITAAAVATFLAYGLNFFLLHIFSQKVYPVNVSLWPVLVTSLVFGILLSLAFYFELNIYLRALLFIASVCVALFTITRKKDIRFIREKGFSVIYSSNS